MFDYNMILIDGTVDVDADTAATYASPTSTNRATATGAAVIDLNVGGTPASVLSVVLIIPALTSSTDYLIAQIEASDAVAFGSDVHVMTTFDVASATTGRILASECTAGLVVVRRFSTKERYVRATIAPTRGTGDGSFSYLKMFLTPYAFNVL